MGLEIYPEKYLSEEAMRSLTLTVNGEDNDVIKQAFLLSDGTTVIIEKLKDCTLNLGKLKNPHEVQINGPSKVKISYCKSHDENNDMSEESVYFTVSSFQDLIEKWSKYKSDRKLDDNIEGTISDLMLTDEDEGINLELKRCVNKILNILLDEDITIDFDAEGIYNLLEGSEEEIDRIHFVKNVIMTIVANIFHNTDLNKLHCPIIKRDKSGFPIEVSSHIDNSLFF